MTSRERITLAIKHKEPDRVPIHDGLWGTTRARWAEEGLPEDTPVADFFGWEIAAFGGDNSLQLPSKVIEETDEYKIATGSDGATVRNWKSKSSTPELIDFLIKTRGDWEQYKDRMVWEPSRVDWEKQRASYEKARSKGLYCLASFYTGYTRICDMCGTDNILMAMADDPDWIRDMLMTRAELCIAITEEMLAKDFEFDCLFVYDDLGFKLRSFFSPAMYRELIMPSHKLICEFFHGHGLSTILHSCGYITELAPLIIETGYDCLQPLEVKAGNDLIELKKTYGEQLAFMGGIDVRAMADPDPAVIEKEISEKIPFAMRNGGYIYHSDHSIPDNVSFERYKYIMDLVAKYGKY
jgi:uroporphyrinogen decarboxylase